MRLPLAFVAVAVATVTAVSFGFVRAGADEDAVRGLWSRHPYGSGPESAPVAFYYFHTDDIGLYRYGKAGYNNTHSYHWSADGSSITLDYNKRGLRQVLQVRLEPGTPKTMIVTDDPNNPGVTETRYTWVPPPDFGSVAADLFDDDDSNSAASDDAAGKVGVDNRLWMDLEVYKTGGMGFSLYQLREAGIDGRGTGWHHLGDFNDWSTEALSYRLLRANQAQESAPAAVIDGAEAAQNAQGIDLQFSLRGERSSSALRVGHRSANGKDVRFLTLQSDPRAFWSTHSYDDAGPSFGSFRSLVLSAAP